MPQWNLPTDVENEPQTRRVKDPYNAALFLFTRTSLDRLSVSSHLHKSALETWRDESKRWIFDPKKIVVREIKEVDNALKEYFSYALAVRPGMSAGEGYRINAQKLVDDYDSDPRNLIKYKTVSQARESIRVLESFGTGLANLLIMELVSRDICRPIDIENIRPKIDRHKARIPLNTDSVTLNGAVKKGAPFSLHTWSLLHLLEETYLQRVNALSLNMLDVDSRLWIIGSEVCARQNYSHCKDNCPLVDTLCVANTSLDHHHGKFRLYDKNGVRIDAREKKGQKYLKF